MANSLLKLVPIPQAATSTTILDFWWTFTKPRASLAYTRNHATYVQDDARRVPSRVNVGNRDLVTSKMNLLIGQVRQTLAKMSH